jgi:hypothetical protein
VSSAAVSALKRQLADALLARTLPYGVTVGASMLGVDVARVSDLRRGRHEQFSLEWLIDRLAWTQCDVRLTTHSRTVDPMGWAQSCHTPRPVNTPRGWRPKRKR